MGELKSKRDAAAALIGQLDKQLRCPFCQQVLEWDQSYRFTCVENHSFDLSKQGSLFLVKQAANSQYDEPLFQARHRIIQQFQLYAPIYEIISLELRDKDVILDAGTGEGSHLNEFKKRFPEIVPIGLDLSKDGINQAGKLYRDSLWIVGDLANLPFQNESVDVILNILSPSNYAEFKRVLKQDGKLIKVIPRANYLQELRKYTSETTNETYSNHQTVALFNQHFSEVQVKTIQYKKELTQAERQAIINMSPLGWSVSAEARQMYIEEGQSTITIDLDLLIAKM
ncbi:methyltransferase domain-containing protein [Shouchella sp. 1P09AA]|uniref:methyltransferase domain-containing protein n=1 Tax=unclassified Shouchella TaxID=2893065 RepID=UPI00399FAD4B